MVAPTIEVFTNINEYNTLMNELIRIPINEITTSTEFVKQNHIYGGDIMSFKDACKIIRDNICNNAFILDILKGEIDVTRKGIIVAIIESIYNCNNINEYVKALICILLHNDTTTIIIQEINTFTNNTSHYANRQEQGTIIFKIAQSPQNFLQWVILCAPILSFFVPSNDDNASSPVVQLKRLKKGLEFYRELHHVLSANELPANVLSSKIHRVLYEQINDLKEYFNEKIRQIITEQNECKISRFNEDDGFDGVSKIDDLKSLRMFDGFYTHKYFDARHLITILLGSQTNPKYRNNYKEYITNEIFDDISKHANKELLLIQLLTRLKIARYEPIKLEPCYDSVLVAEHAAVGGAAATAGPHPHRKKTLRFNSIAKKQNALRLGKI